MKIIFNLHVTLNLSELPAQWLHSITGSFLSSYYSKCSTYQKNTLFPILYHAITSGTCELLWLSTLLRTFTILSTHSPVWQQSYQSHSSRLYIDEIDYHLILAKLKCGCLWLHYVALKSSSKSLAQKLLDIHFWAGVLHSFEHPLEIEQ